MVVTPGEALDDGKPFALVGHLVGITNEVAGRGSLGSPRAVIVERGRIVAIDDLTDTSRLPAQRLEADFVAPGFIDLQVNGGFGVEVGDDPTALRTLAARLPATGVTGFLPALISRPAASYATAFAALHAAITDGSVRQARPARARLLGVHLEGPLLAAERAGAHERAHIEAARSELVESLIENLSAALPDPTSIRFVTLAPEREGALPLISRLSARGIRVSVGHTNAGADVVAAAGSAGAVAVTHLFNAMSPFSHRVGGAAGGALVDDRLTALIIADGVHIDATALKVAWRCKGKTRLALATDAMAGAAMPPGRYTLSGRNVICDGTSARLPDGTLAGSTLTMDAAVRNLVHLAGVAPEDALYAAAVTPRRLLGLDARGPWSVGADADIVLLDTSLTVQATFCRGRVAYRRPIV